MIRPAEVALPILREALPDVTVNTWAADVDHRTYPLVLLRRAGGPRHASRPRLLGLPELEITAISDEGPAESEELYEDVLEALYVAVRAQIVVPDVGHLHSISEPQGATQVPSKFADTWATEGTVRVGIRPTRVAPDRTARTTSER